MNDKVLAVDIGTSSIKAGIIDKKGIPLSCRKIFYKDIGGDIHNWKTDYWINSLEKILKDLPLLEKAEAVVFSGSAPSVIPIDKNGNYIEESLLWLDNKKIDIEDKKSFFLPKIAWFKENRKDIYSNISCFMPLSGFFPYLLTGELKEPLPNKEFTPYIWTEDSIKKLGIECTVFPQFVTTGDLVGYVSEKGSRKFYLKKGIPLFAGANDYLMALLGTGTLFEGAVCDRAGTSEGINYCSKKNMEFNNLRVLPHIAEGLYNISGILDSSGKTFDWFRKISGQEERSYAALIKKISKVIHNNDHLYFFPNLKRDSVWRFSGGAFVGLEIKHGIPETGAAVLKSIGFSVREVIRTMESYSLDVQDIRLSGGQAKNSLWNQIKADMTGKKLLAPEVKESELIGCACAAFKGLGLYSSLTQASQEMVRIKDVYKPNEKAFSVFSKFFEEYSEISNKFESFANSF
ncbi:MAG: FGGY-family carbohydrate kinase [Spirochaetaceae bacterium]|nr:FGGY-family carbohydrate kinase [Spirochaetaceae bacterium]